MSLIDSTRTKRGAVLNSLEQMRYVMGTFLRMELKAHADDESLNKVMEEAFGEVSRLEHLLSRFRHESEVFRLNQYAHRKPQYVKPEVFRLLQECIAFSGRTDGAFHMATGSLSEYWAQCARDLRFPSEAVIKRLVDEIHPIQIQLDEMRQQVFFREPSTKIDFGGVGKGYAIDRVIKILRAAGIQEAVLDFGGQIYYLRTDGDMNGATFGIVDPLEQENVALCVSLRNQAMSTSASYERGFEIRGITYSHVLDPRTGYPIDNDLLSVTAICPSAQLADMLSTAAFVLGSDAGMKLIDGFEGAQLVMITASDGILNVEASQGRDVPDAVIHNKGVMS